MKKFEFIDPAIPGLVREIEGKSIDEIFEMHPHLRGRIVLEDTFSDEGEGILHDAIRVAAKNKWDDQEALCVLDDVLWHAGYKKNGDYRRWILTRLSELTGEAHYLE